MRDGLLIAFGVVLVLIGVGAIVVSIRRQRADPHIRQPGQHDAAVQRALRDGHADDPRIEALARSAAVRAVRQRWILWVLPLASLLFGAGVAVDLRDPDSTGWDIGSSVVWTVIPVIVFVRQFVQLRRSRRYLHRDLERHS